MARYSGSDMTEALKAYRQINATAIDAQQPQTNNNQPDACIMYQVDTILDDIRDAYLYRQRLIDRITEMRLNALGSRAIRYDKDRVSGGVPYTMDMIISDIIEKEAELMRVDTQYQLQLLDFESMMRDAGFSDVMRIAWIKRYVEGWSLGRIASWYDMPKHKVQYQCDKAMKQFYGMLSEVVAGADYN